MKLPMQTSILLQLHNQNTQLTWKTNKLPLVINDMTFQMATFLTYNE